MEAQARRDISEICSYQQPDKSHSDCKRKGMRERNGEEAKQQQKNCVRGTNEPKQLLNDEVEKFILHKDVVVEQRPRYNKTG